MSEAASTPREECNRALRELAGTQGVAYRAYSEALQRFGDSQIGFTELLRTAGDIYFRESGNVAKSLFEASARVYGLVLASVGAKLS